MNELKQLQSDFLQAIFDGPTNTPNQILASQQLTEEQRMGLYQDAYRLRLIEALADSYPILHKMAGDQQFEEICLSYIDSYPSQHFSIRYFGQRMPEFLAKQCHTANYAYFSELALFEKSLNDAFDGINATPITREDLMQFTPEQWPTLSFKLLPTFQLLALQWNVPPMWKAMKNNNEVITAEYTDLPNQWIVWRPELEIKFRSIDNTEAFALGLVQQQHNFLSLCEQLADCGLAEPAPTIAGLLARWTGDRLICSVLQS